MNVNEMVKNRVYEWNNHEYKMTDDGLLVNNGGCWTLAHIDYNRAIKMNFEEVVRIPDENTPVNTKVRVTDYENDGWIYPRYFANYLPNASCKFWVFSDGDKSEKAAIVVGWKYCEIIEESEVAE